MATLKEIAALAQVSYSTVSNVLMDPFFAELLEAVQKIGREDL